MADQISTICHQAWFDRYMSADSNGMGYFSDVIQEVIPDALDDGQIEARVVRLEQEVTVTAHFCSSCHDVFAKWPSSTSTNDESRSKMLHKVNSLSIEAAARNGCYLCELYLQELKDKDMLRVIRRVERRLENITGQRPLSAVWAKPTRSESAFEERSYHITIQWPDKSYGSEGYIVWIDSFSEISATAHVSEASRETFDIAKDWLLDCDRKHDSCEISEGPMPTRLLCLLDDTPRVIRSECIGKRVPYATLSHCWGDANFTKLTSAQSEAFTSKVDSEHLPENFRHAIEIVQGLGLNYIWIDSLCIIQDNESDWSREAAAMTSVYAGAYVNLASSSATSANEGCLGWPPTAMEGFRTFATTESEKLVLEFNPELNYERAVSQSHLSSRAWAVQEKILPARTIHFGKYGVYWQCRDGTATRVLHDCKPSRFPLWSPFNWERFLAHPKNITDPCAWWMDVVRVYSDGKLTLERDKLRAIAGVARYLHDREHWPYLAGLWWNDTIEKQLCWRVLHEEKSKKPSQWRAPSWSWASLDGLVISEHDDMEFECSKYVAYVVGATIRPSGEDLFGEIQSGNIRIASCSILYGQLSGSRVCIRYGELKVSFTVHLDFLNELCDDISDEDDNGNDNGNGNDNCNDNDNGNGNGNYQDVYLQPFWISDGPFNGRIQISGLLLRSVNQESSHFTRLGSFCLSDRLRCEGMMESYQASVEIQPEVVVAIFEQLLCETGHSLAMALGEELIFEDKEPTHWSVYSIS